MEGQSNINNSNENHKEQSNKANEATSLLDQQFLEKLHTKTFRKDKQFNSKPENQKKIILYLDRLIPEECQFEVLQEIMKSYRIMSLLSFEKFYGKLKTKNSFLRSNKQKIQRLGALAKALTKPFQFSQLEQLNFYKQFGFISKGFNLKPEQEAQTKFRVHLGHLLTDLTQAKKNTAFNIIPLAVFKQLLIKIQIILREGTTPFGSYYLCRMIEQLFSIYQSHNKVQNSQQKQSLSSDEVDKNNSYYRLVKNFVETNIDIKNSLFHESLDNYLKILRKAYKKKSFTRQFANIMINLVKVIRYTVLEINENKRKLKLKAKSAKPVLDEQDSFSFSFSSVGQELDCSKISLQCRKQFFEYQRIVFPSDHRTIFKDWKFPYSPQNIHELKKYICTFLNGLGGYIYLGIRETAILDRVYRFVFSNYITEDIKDQIQQIFYKISQEVLPNVNNQSNIKVEFAPIRNYPTGKIAFPLQISSYQYDFTDRGVDILRASIRNSQYVIRVKILPASQERMHSFIDSPSSQSKGSSIQKIAYYNPQLQIVEKQVCQAVLDRYRQKLLFKFTKSNIRIESCVPLSKTIWTNIEQSQQLKYERQTLQLEYKKLIQSYTKIILEKKIK